MKKIYLVTHNDLDGAGCEILARKYFMGYDITVKRTDYNKVNRVVWETLDQIGNDITSTLFLTDISFKGNDTDNLVQKINFLYDSGQNIVMIDHHETSQYLGDFQWCTHIMGTCATKILFKCFNLPTDGIIDRFASSVDAYDLWKLDSPYREHGEDLNRLYHFYGHDLFVKNLVETIEHADSVEWLCHILRENEKQSVDSIIESSKEFNQTLRVDNRGNKYYLLWSEFEINETATRLLEQNSEIDYVAAIVPGKRKVSLRTSKDRNVNVAEIAERNHGGGHKDAAGFYYSGRAPEILLEDFVNSLLRPRQS